MVSMLTTAPGEKQPSVADFTKHYGPWIIFATVIVPLIVAAVTNLLRKKHRYVLTKSDTRHTPIRTALNHLYVALVAPLGELAARLGWGVLIVIGLILTYTLCYNIWSSFAFPFYLDFLHYSKDEVAFASKIFGIFMTMIGFAVGGYLFARIGRLPTVLIGAILPVLGNFVYADLAEGGPNIDAVAHALRLDALAVAFGSRTNGWSGCCSPSAMRISQPALPAPRSSPSCRASSASALPRFNMRCFRRSPS